MVRKRSQRLVSNVPNMFTAGNILCGFLSILMSIEGKVQSASWLIFAGAFFDFMDGRIARFTKTQSDIGVELDSLADFLTFGIAPMILIHQLGGYTISDWKLVLPIIFIIAVAFRLARFNVEAQPVKLPYFRGLPSPAAALFVVSYTMFSSSFNWDFLDLEKAIVPILIVSSWLMISHVRFLSVFARKRLGRLIEAIILAIFAILILIRAQIFVFPIILFYILFCFARELYLLTNILVKKRSSHEKIQSDSQSEKETGSS
ncbi:MAG: CDP-diacylglycerol--serine O-phosphatidyltransferase [Candidatus Zixiibacteriota bacterium]